MISLHKTTLLLKPSLLGGMICGVITMIVIGVIAWSHIAENGLFYEFLFGRYGVATTFVIVPSNTMILQHAIINSSITYYFIVSIAGIMVGVLIYALLQGVGRIREEAMVVADELRTHDPRLKSTVYSDLSRLGVRLASLVAWLVYWIIFVNILWPFVVSLMQMGLINISAGQLSGWLAIGAATMLFYISLHLHITFMRLCTLRIRLFGGFMEEVH